MNKREKDMVVEAANQRRGAISDAKGPEYAGQAALYTDDASDVLANFKRQDKRWGFDGSGLESAFIYFGKHLDAIETFGRELLPLLGEEPMPWEDVLDLINRGEGIISRLDDARNYLDLIECLLVDAKLHPSEPAPADREGWPTFPQNAILRGDSR